MTTAKAMPDAETVAGWMEPKPAQEPSSAPGWSLGRWWAASPSAEGPRWVARPIYLDRIWQVEERLITERLASRYNAELRRQMSDGEWFWHLDAPRKIRALAAVIRSVGDAK